MKRYYTYLIAIAFLIQGCEKSNQPLPGEEPGEEEAVAVILGGKSAEAIVDTKAVSDFPNQQRIGVVAAEYNSGSVDWTSYDDIHNAEAKTRTESGGEFTFHFEPVKYWPFDGSELVFLAYSPAADDTAVTLQSNRTVLDLTLVDNMPDVMYASNNVVADQNPKSKTSGTVDLGEFRHALSQVTIRVTPGAEMNPNIRLTDLWFQTLQTTATLDLEAGDGGLTVNGPSGTFRHVILENASVNFSQTDYTYTMHVFPGTQMTSTVYVRFTDGPFDVEKTSGIMQFTDVDNPGQTITFRQGEQTFLQFTVISTEVEEPDDAIVLEGQLTDWKEMGNFNVIIQ